MRSDGEPIQAGRPAGGGGRSVVLFRVGEGEFAVDAQAVRHVEASAASDRVVDRRRRLGAGAAGPPPWLCGVVRRALGEVAVTVDAVLGLEPAAGAGPDGAPCVDLAAIGIAGGAEDGPRAAH